jgi:hypothetical protein
MGWQNLRSIEGLQHRKEMRRKNLAAFSHTPKRVPKPIPLLTAVASGFLGAKHDV